MRREDAIYLLEDMISFGIGNSKETNKALNIAIVALLREERQEKVGRGIDLLDSAKLEEVTHSLARDFVSQYQKMKSRNTMMGYELGKLANILGERKAEIKELRQSVEGMVEVIEKLTEERNELKHARAAEIRGSSYIAMMKG